ncbi:hypothetical protein BH23ACT12_BH23ACT12_09700 [soil metagenome]
MSSNLPLRFALLLGPALLTLGLMMPGAASAATPGATPIPTVSPSASSTHTTLPPFEGDTALRPVRSRSDKIISTIAPIAMVMVLVAGLYIYWLIRKGL